MTVWGYTEHNYDSLGVHGIQLCQFWGTLNTTIAVLGDTEYNYDSFGVH